MLLLWKILFLFGFIFLGSDKEENVIWALEVCMTFLKDQENMPNVIVIDRNISLMNLVAKMFPTSYALLCRYHITKNVRSRRRHVVRTKQIKGGDGKMAKASVILESILDVWNFIINSSKKELYVDFVIYFRKGCKKHQDFLKHVESKF